MKPNRIIYFIIFLSNVWAFVDLYVRGLWGAWFNLFCAIMMIWTQYLMTQRTANPRESGITPQ